MNTYIVLYRNPDDDTSDPPFGFKCQADDADHAEEQCINAEPAATILWVSKTNDVNKAYSSYCDSL